MHNSQNNIFDFATKELSQDAFLCWIMNWINYPESDLFSLACEFFVLLGVKDFIKEQNVTIKQQVNKADIVVALHSQKIIIVIEDKVYSTEHDDQIKQYTEYFKDINNQIQMENNSSEPYEVRSVYFKTGYFYDTDKNVVADTIVDGDEFLNLISGEKYQHKSEILDEYVDHLKDVLGYYKKYGNYLEKENGRYYISTETIAQHNFMRSIFPEESTWDKESGLFMVETGSSSGRPYAEVTIAKNLKFENYDKTNYLFWRVDTNSGGPYISLRLYDWYDKKDEIIKKTHNKLYDYCMNISKNVFAELKETISLSWDDVQDGNNGNYYEASLFTIKLIEYLEKWDSKGNQLINDINAITNKIVNAISDNGE